MLCWVPHRSIVCAASQISLLLRVLPAGREGERERQEELCSQVFSFPRPSSVLLSSCKVIAFLAHAGLRGMEPSQEKGHLGGGLWSRPQTDHLSRSTSAELPFSV